jgi:hypothetical protein
MSPAVPVTTKEKGEPNYTKWILVLFLILLILGGMFVAFKYITAPPPPLRNNGIRMNNSRLK